MGAACPAPPAHQLPLLIPASQPPAPSSSSSLPACLNRPPTCPTNQPPPAPPAPCLSLPPAPPCLSLPPAPAPPLPPPAPPRLQGDLPGGQRHCAHEGRGVHRVQLERRRLPLGGGAAHHPDPHHGGVADHEGEAGGGAAGQGRAECRTAVVALLLARRLGCPGGGLPLPPTVPPACISSCQLPYPPCLTPCTLPPCSSPPAFCPLTHPRRAATPTSWRRRSLSRRRRSPRRCRGA